MLARVEDQEEVCILRCDLEVGHVVLDNSKTEEDLTAEHSSLIDEMAMGRMAGGRFHSAAS